MSVIKFSQRFNMVKRKIKKLRRGKIIFFCSLVFLITPSLQGAEIETESFRQNPFESVDKMTAQLLDIIGIYKSDYPSNEDAYFLSLDQLMGDFVDFNFVARRVMGKYHSNFAPEQRKSFIDVFRRGLIESYGRGLMAYSNENIIILNRQDVKNLKRIIVKQEIRDSVSAFPLQYLLFKKKTDQTWVIVNVSLNGINLTKTFGSQFQNSMKRYSGDLNKVIQDWL